MHRTEPNFRQNVYFQKKKGHMIHLKEDDYIQNRAETMFIYRINNRRTGSDHYTTCFNSLLLSPNRMIIFRIERKLCRT